MKFVLFFLTAIFPVFLMAQPVTITGTAPGAEGKTIRLFVIRDFITFTEEEAAHAKIDSVGQFSIKYDIAKTVSAVLAIDFHRVELFLEPHKAYQLEIAPMNYNSSLEVNPFIQSENLAVDFRNEDPEELNALVQQFNILHSNFLLKHFNDLYRDREIALLDTFRFEVLRSFKFTKNQYFAIYIRYKMAALEQVAKAFPPAQLAKRYFSDSPVLYDNVEYMSFFNEFFMKFITVTSRSLKFIDYHAILKNPDSYTNLMKALEADTLLKNPQLRELVMLKGLKEMYEIPGYSKENVLNLLREVSVQSKFPEHRLIAVNISNAVTHLQPGSKAPGFSLTDRNKKTVKLIDLKGKPVVLNFWTTYCQTCLSELEGLKVLYEKYKDRISFVSISADKEFLKMLFFIDLKKDFKWTFLHIGDQLELLRDYDVKSYPLFVLIDSSGNIFKYPANSPEKGLEQEIENLIHP